MLGFLSIFRLYFTIFKSATFQSQVQYLGRQLFPSAPKFLLDAYQKATEEPYTYLFVNLHPTCHDHLRVQSGILSNENQYVYTPIS